VNPSAAKHAAFGRAAEMQPLHHRSCAGTGKFHQSARQRTGDAKRVGHARRVEPQQNAGRHRCTERAGGARCVKAASLVAVLRRVADPVHHLEAGDHGGDQLAPAAAAFLRHR
jgi:hypothetical protein